MPGKMYPMYRNIDGMSRKLYVMQRIINRIPRKLYGMERNIDETSRNLYGIQRKIEIVWKKCIQCTEILMECQINFMECKEI